MFFLFSTPIDETNLGALTVAEIAAGSFHSMLRTSDGSVFSFGFNGNGRAGLGAVVTNALIATAIDTSNLGTLDITQISAGDSHSLVLADDGSVFSFGTHANGRTGRATDMGDTFVAMAIDTTNLVGVTIVQVSAASMHSLLLADDGSVYAFGSNLGGRTGLGTAAGDTLIATAIDTSLIGSLAIVDISAGTNHRLLLAENGAVFSFGFNGSGGTGLGTIGDQTTIATPIDTTNLGGGLVTGISAGRSHSLIVVPEPTGGGLAALASLVAVGFRRHQCSRRDPPRAAAPLAPG